LRRDRQLIDTRHARRAHRRPFRLRRDEWRLRRCRQRRQLLAIFLVRLDEQCRLRRHRPDRHVLDGGDLRTQRSGKFSSGRDRRGSFGRGAECLRHRAVPLIGRAGAFGRALFGAFGDALAAGAQRLRQFGKTRGGGDRLRRRR